MSQVTPGHPASATHSVWHILSLQSWKVWVELSQVFEAGTSMFIHLSSYISILAISDYQCNYCHTSILVYNEEHIKVVFMKEIRIFTDHYHYLNNKSVKKHSRSSPN